MPPYDIDIGQLSNALRITGGNERLAAQMLEDEERRKQSLAGISRGDVQENLYNEPEANPYGPSMEVGDITVKRGAWLVACCRSVPIQNSM